MLEKKVELLLDHPTVPVGAVPETLLTTFAVHLSKVPTTTEAWLHDMVRVDSGLTNKVATFDEAVTPALSVTWSSKDQVPTVERRPVDSESADEVVQLEETPRLV